MGHNPGPPTPALRAAGIMAQAMRHKGSNLHGHTPLLEIARTMPGD
jgi:hypothetical protein